MTNKQQSAFFLAIVFLFASGIGLVIYKQYDQYYQQKTAIDLESVYVNALPTKKASTATANTGSFKMNVGVLLTPVQSILTTDTLGTFTITV